MFAEALQCSDQACTRVKLCSSASLRLKKKIPDVNNRPFRVSTSSPDSKVLSHLVVLSQSSVISAWNGLADEESRRCGGVNTGRLAWRCRQLCRLMNLHAPHALMFYDGLLWSWLPVCVCVCVCVYFCRFRLFSCSVFSRNDVSSSQCSVSR